MRNPFNTVTLALIPLAIVINIVIGELIAVLKIPFYLDSIGTVLVGVLAGPLAGALTGLLSNLVWAIIPFSPSGASSFAAWFSPVAAIIGALAGWFGSRGWLRRLPHTILGGLITGLIAALVSAPIAARVFGGVTGAGTDLLVAAFQSFTENLQNAVLLQGVASDLPDKMVSFLLVYLILRGLPRRLLVRFPQGDKSAEPRREPLVGRVQR
jgi:energy-coupling factor transport system substrate-specific component